MSHFHTRLQAPLLLDIPLAQLIKTITQPVLSQNVSDTILLRSGTTADIHHSVRCCWDLMLQASQAVPGAEVILSGINIKHMRDIVTAHGLKPVYADVEPDTLLPSLAEIKSKKTDRTIGVLCAHLFGTWSPLDNVAEWCRAQKIFLAEDCAQAFMGHDFEGTQGASATFFSFGTIKRSTALGGAVAIIRDRSLRQSMLALSREYPVQQEIQFRKKVAKSMAIRAICEPHAYAAAVKLLELQYGSHEEVLRNAVRGFPSGTVPHIFRTKPCAALRALVTQRFRESEQKIWLERGEQMFASLERARLPRNVLLGYNAHVHTFWLIPITVSNPDAAMNAARNRGYDATRGITSMMALSGEQDSKAATILRNIVYLPVAQNAIFEFSHIAPNLLT
jgi:perosamine synthetase